MVSTKTAALATAVIAFLGWGIQLGSLAAWNSYACRSSSSIVTLDAAALTSLLSGRKLLAAPSESELNARCSFSLGMDWCVHSVSCFSANVQLLDMKCCNLCP